MKAAVLHGPRDLRIEPHRQPELRAGMVLLHPRRVGICGTDLHYYEHGHNATFIPDRPFILGHELTAEVAAVADDVETLQIGQRVTVNPARSCGFCAYCKSGRINLCRKTIMLGSASTTPPTDGALAEFVTPRGPMSPAAGGDGRWNRRDDGTSLRRPARAEARRHGIRQKRAGARWRNDRPAGGDHRARVRRGSGGSERPCSRSPPQGGGARCGCGPRSCCTGFSG